MAIAARTIDKLVKNESVATVKTEDGRTFTGQLVKLETGSYKVATGKRGRPFVFDRTTVELVEETAVA